MRNRFYTWFGGKESPTEITPAEVLPKMPPGDAKYHVRIMQHLDHLLPQTGLTFILTWHVDDFHEAMQDGVVILAGDEKAQIPSYHRKVRAMFKTMGYWPNPLGESLRLPFPIAWRSLLRDARNGYIRFRRRLKYGPTGKIVAPHFEIPIGYFSLLDVEPPPIAQRPVDVFFAGFCNPAGWSLRVQYKARQQMAAAVEATRIALPQCRIEWLPQTGGFGQGLSPEEYTRSLANAKIALAPRGIIEESFRFIEGAKMGCVVISEPIPRRWYFQECPAVILREWSELPGVLSKLLADPEKMSQLSQRTRQWYESTISEAAVAKYMAECLTNAQVALRAR